MNQKAHKAPNSAEIVVFLSFRCQITHFRSIYPYDTTKLGSPSLGKREIDLLSRVHKKNMAVLVGFCLEEGFE
jgi:hypothetical protein